MESNLSHLAEVEARGKGKARGAFCKNIKPECHGLSGDLFSPRKTPILSFVLWTYKRPLPPAYV
jgi:hypothetical protein